MLNFSLQDVSSAINTTSDTKAWVIVLLIVVPSLAGILGGVAAILSSRRAKDVAGHLVKKQESDKKWMDQTIGQVNGHGSLMRQVTITMERVGQLAEHIYDLKTGQTHLSEGQGLLTSEIVAVKESIKDHISESDAIHKEIATCLNSAGMA